MHFQDRNARLPVWIELVLLNTVHQPQIAVCGALPEIKHATKAMASSRAVLDWGPSVTFQRQQMPETPEVVLAETSQLSMFYNCLNTVGEAPSDF